MKRVLLVLTIMLSVLTLSSCMSEEDYYTRTEIDQIVVNAVETETAALVTRIDELNQFGKILDKIVEDDDARDLYIEAGLLEKCEALKERILSKLS